MEFGLFAAAGWDQSADEAVAQSAQEVGKVPLALHPMSGDLPVEGSRIALLAPLDQTRTLPRQSVLLLPARDELPGVRRARSRHTPLALPVLGSAPFLQVDPATLPHRPAMHLRLFRQHKIHQLNNYFQFLLILKLPNDWF